MLVKTTADKLIIRDAPAGYDTGKRFLKGQTAESTAFSVNKQWQLIEAPQGVGWASSQYLVLASAPTIPGTAVPRILYTLEGEDPEFTERIENLRELAADEGIEFDTADFGGVRSEADTVKIMRYRDNDYAVYVKNMKRKGKKPVSIGVFRPINKFGTSHHNFGFARDLKITRYPSSFTKDRALQRLGALAPEAGLVWGGTFDRYDGPHFQMPITLAEARRRYEARR